MSDLLEMRGVPIFTVEFWHSGKLHEAVITSINSNIQYQTYDISYYVPDSDLSEDDYKILDYKLKQRVAAIVAKMRNWMIEPFILGENL